MNFSIVRIDSGEWDVRSPDGKSLGLFVTRNDAMRELARQFQATYAMIAAGAPQGRRFEASFQEGERTVDNRIIDSQATNFKRVPPLPWMWTNENSYGHEGSVVVGVIDTLNRDGDTIVLQGAFDISTEGTEAERMVDDGVMTRWSPDIADASSMIEVLEEDEDGWPTIVLEHLTDGTLIGGTQVPFPALDSASIKLIAAASEEQPAEGDQPTEAPAETPEPEAQAASGKPELQLVAGGAPVKPPAEWFDDPQLEEATALTITEEGRIFGHLAAWGTCHIGREDVCVTPPNSNMNYAYFRTGAIETDDGQIIPTGVITLGTSHAPITRGVDAAAAAEHYDNTGTGVADAAAGEDGVGIWIAGALRPDVSDEQKRILMASALSGDWRTVGGSLELVAALAVNVPGFPIERTSTMVAGGVCEAMVAAGVSPIVRATQDDSVAAHLDRIDAQLAMLTTVVRPLSSTAIDWLHARVHAKS